MELKAQTRELSESLNALRKSGQVPAVFYGHKTEATNITVNATDFDKIYKEVGKSSIFTLEVNGKGLDVLVKGVDYHPVKDNVRHVDFYVPTKGQEMEVDVPFEFTGEAPAEKAGNIVNKILRSVKIKSLPKNIPDHIEISMENLENIGDHITLADITLPKNTSFAVEELTETIINISGAKSAEDEEEANSGELDTTVSEEEEKTEEKKTDSE